MEELYNSAGVIHIEVNLLCACKLNMLMNYEINTRHDKHRVNILQGSEETSSITFV